MNGEKGKDNSLNKIVLAALHQLPTEKATDYVLSLLKDDSAYKTLENGEKLNVPVGVIFVFVCLNFYKSFSSPKWKST